MATTKPECFLCAAPANQNDACSGCNKTVCEPCCDNIDVPWGKHEPQEHATPDRLKDAERERARRTKK